MTSGSCSRILLFPGYSEMFLEFCCMFLPEFQRDIWAPSVWYLVVYVPKRHSLALPAATLVLATKQGHVAVAYVFPQSVSWLVFPKAGQVSGARRLRLHDGIVFGTPGFQAWICPVICKVDACSKTAVTIKQNLSWVDFQRYYWLYSMIRELGSIYSSRQKGALRTCTQCESFIDRREEGKLY